MKSFLDFGLLGNPILTVRTNKNMSDDFSLSFFV